MSFVTIMNRNLVKTIASTRCLSSHSNYMQSISEQMWDCGHISSVKKLIPPSATPNISFQFVRFKYDKSTNKKGKEEVNR